jgi:O-antigen/teichoic acid export membrane protein
MTSAESPARAGDLLDSRRAGPVALRGGALRAAGYALGILLSLVAVPLLVRHLGTAGYGRYVTVVALMMIVAGVTEGGLNAIALRAYASAGGGERARLMRDALGARLALTTAGAVAAIGFAAVAGYGSKLVLGTALAAVALVLQAVSSLLGVSLQVELRFGWVAAAELLQQFVSVVAIVVLVLVGAGIVPLLAAAIPASAASLLLTLALVRGRMPLRPAFELGVLWPLLRESVPWAAAVALNVVYFRLALVIMSVSATAIETGYFALSYRIIEVLIGIPAVAVSAAYPILLRSAREDRERFVRAAGRMFELALVGGVLMVICIEVGARFAVHVLAGHHADPAVAVLRIQGPAVAATFVSVACAFPLLTIGHYRRVLLVNLVAIVIVASATVPLADALGARGAAISALSAELVLGALSAAMLARSGARLPLGSVPLIVLAGAAATALGLVLPIGPILGALAACGAYAVLLRLFGRFPPEARELLVARARPLMR